MPPMDCKPTRQAQARSLLLLLGRITFISLEVEPQEEAGNIRLEVQEDAEAAAQEKH